MIDGDSWSLNSINDSKTNRKANKSLNLDLCSTITDLEEIDTSLFATHQLKYMGYTHIEATRSEKLVANAIKTLKSNRTKGQAQRNVTINVLPTEVEIIDIVTQEIILNLSIYDVSYCTAQHEFFALVGSEKCPSLDQEKLLCYVFQCPKRKVAKQITLAVARSFGYAYQHWRQKVIENNRSETIDRLKLSLEDNNFVIQNDIQNGEFGNQSKNWVTFDESKELL
ncbi:uncharacterized protein Dwil_GK14892 [Drosophila willistoni]|uniref:PID domain-containing protein n=2 Tax=Drosophila willistoni TaxID=7260 RepID=B4MWE8_DROWI|nr:uncharacterized protein Dwil_GK14892 [Drosophila willistoni]